MVSNKDKKLIAAVGVGGLAIWLLTRQSVSASGGDVKIGQIMINQDDQKVYVLGTDLKIHEILDPSILSSDQISESLRVNTAKINSFEEGGAFVCLT